MLKNTPNGPYWPPRSPHEALLSSPSGREKVRRLQNRLSPSPSPVKRLLSTPSFPPRAQCARPHAQTNGVSNEFTAEGDNSEDDEETLQLQLQAVEAKLKLKKLKQLKSRNAAQSLVMEYKKTGDSNSVARDNDTVTPRVVRRSASEKEGQPRASRVQPDVQIPLSPPGKERATEEPRSPGRVLLGIDKGRKGRDVSLKKAPVTGDGGTNSKLSINERENRMRPRALHYGHEISSRAVSNVSNGGQNLRNFSARITESRDIERNQKEKELRICKARSTGFGLDEKELEASKSVAEQSSGLNTPRRTPSNGNSQQYFSRDEVLEAYNRPVSGLVRRNKSVSTAQTRFKSASDFTMKSVYADTADGLLHPRKPVSSSIAEHNPNTASSAESKRGPSSTITTNDPSHFDSFSTLHLSKRLLPHVFLTRTLAGRRTFLIPDLLKIVKAPDYETPDIEEDFVLFGIIASKSSPLSHKEDRKTTAAGQNTENGRGKYMVLTLTDLKWELDLFLFGTGFDRWWKLTPGTVIAILNPAIMPPVPSKRDTGKFSLTLSSSDDTVLEVGTARDLGFCKTVKRDGKECNQWIDGRHTEFCAFHVDVQLKKVTAGRMEVNTITAPFGPGGRSGSGTCFSSGRPRGGEGKRKDDGLKREGAYHDRTTHSRVYIAPSIPGMGRSSASLLDDDDVDADGFHRGTSKEERLQRRLAEREKEKEVARRLGEGGNGMGGAYLRAQHVGSSASIDANGESQDGPAGVVDAQSLGLLGVRADAVRLSPMKRKRSQNISSSAAVGWGGAYKKALQGPIRRTGSVSRLDGSEPPVNKKTRFITTKGIREAGRGSFGVPSAPPINGDDDLEFV
ncbi:MAG: hypothetical protein M1827_002791 [Pycnora praestabilis]|nr:MAG: hypothetical protein M1827_002791 [Pycnora praestabilis]